MSAAQNEITAEEKAELTKKRRAARKKREISRRHVVNVPDDMALWLMRNKDTLRVSGVPQALRLLAAEALRARGITATIMRAEFKQYLAEKAMLEAQEALAEAEAEAADSVGV